MNALRITSAVLWFFAGWYIGNFIAAIFGVGLLYGPIIGAATAGLLVGDPLGVIWSTRKPAAATSIDPLPEAV